MQTLLKVFRRFLLVGAGFSVVLNLVLLAPALFMLQVFDRVLVSRSVETLMLLAAIGLGWLVLGLVLDVLRQRVLSHAAAHLDRGYGAALLARLVSNAADPQKRFDTSQLRDLSTVRTFIAGPAILALFDAPWIVIYLVIIALFHPLLGVLALSAMALLVALAWISDRLTARSAERAQVAGSKAGAFVQASMRAADAVAAHGMASHIARHWLDLHTDALSHTQTVTRVTATVGGVTRMLRQMLQIVMLGAGAWLVIEMHVSAGVTLAATVILGRMLAPLESITASWKVMADSRGAWARLAGSAPALVDESHEFRLPAPTGRLQVENLCFSPAPDHPPTLRNVSFSLEPGEVLAVIGPSGSGKSTLSRLLTGVWKPAAGSVRLDGTDIGNWDRGALGPHLGYCPQDVQLISGSVAQNVARFGEIDSEAVVLAARRAGCEGMIARLPNDYRTEIGEAGARLSGGERQRVALARVLYGDPRFVVLDEPNANLDADGEHALEQVIGDLRSRKVTTVIVTQRMNVVELADKVLVMREGTVEKLGRRKTDEDPAPPLQVIRRAS